MPRSRTRAVLILVLVVALTAAAGGAIGLILVNRMESGEWTVPSGNDLVRVRRAVTRKEESPTRIIYLHRGAIELLGGADDAPRRHSSIVQRSGGQVIMPGYRGTHARWRDIVTCVSNLFAPFNVAVTDVLPAEDDFILVVVGGRARLLDGGDAHRGHVAGLAPFLPGRHIPRAVVFAFSEEAYNRPRPVCETIGMEVGHAYGLDHAHHCKDVMTYLPSCGRKSFTDNDSRCGEKTARDCADKAPTQNAHRYLLDLLGPRADE